MLIMSHSRPVNIGDPDSDDRYGVLDENGEGPQTPMLRPMTLTSAQINCAAPTSTRKKPERFRRESASVPTC